MTSPGPLLLLATLAALLAVLLAAAVNGLLGYRRRLHDLLGRSRGDRIPTIELSALDEAFRSDDLGPTLAAEARFIGGGDGVPHGTSDREAWILSVLAKRARVLFEFGTATGRTAYLWARNSPAEATVTTLTLAPEQRDAYRAASGDARGATERALAESVYTRFRYTGTEVEGKVKQLFGDSKALDDTPWEGRCDLVFVDGSHALSYVESDSRKALRMVAPGGLVLWHDYRSPRGRVRDVYRFLDRLARTIPLVRLAGTSLVAYRRPGDAVSRAAAAPFPVPSPEGKRP